MTVQLRQNLFLKSRVGTCTQNVIGFNLSFDQFFVETSKRAQNGILNVKVKAPFS